MPTHGPTEAAATLNINDNIQDTAVIPAPNDNDHSESSERGRQEPTIWCCHRHSGSSRMFRTTTISQEEPNSNRIPLPFVVVDEHNQSREGAAKMRATGYKVSSTYTMAER